MGVQLTSRIVIPGEVIAEGTNYNVKGPAIVGYDGKILATKVGLLRIKGRDIQIVPLAGRYIAKQNDSVIGIVTDYSIVYWILEINYVWKARLDASDFLKRNFDPSKERITKFLKIGDVVYAKIAHIERAMPPILSCRDQIYGKLSGGRLISVNPVKIPRIIGVKNSMLETIKRTTKSEIKVGANGIIWVKAEKPEIEELVERAIKRIERESHLSGLTKRIQNFLIKGMHQIQKGEWR